MIEIRDLEKNYDGFHLHVSMDVPEGKIIGLIGKNGMGKSTVIKSILGLIHPDAGQILINGEAADTLTDLERQKMGIALAESGFSEYLNLAVVGKILKAMYQDFDQKFFDNASKRFGIPEKKQIKDYSTGMRAKLRIVTALSHQAKILILDEPTAGLDIEARNEILDILRTYMAENEERSVLITSHIATDLEGLCDEVYLIHKGGIILHEETDCILSDYAVLKMDESTYQQMLANKENTYFLAERIDKFSCSCLTNEKQYFLDNYPGIVIEHAGIDDLILMLTNERRG